MDFYRDHQERLKQSTGYPFWVLESVWEKYKHEMGLSLMEMLNIYEYIHLYPTYRRSPLFFDYQPSQFHEKVICQMKNVAACLDEIHWEDRLHHFNHTPHFPKYFTGKTSN
jgi:hypothetical protein